MFICLNSLIGVGEAEMEEKDNTFNYLNAKLTEISFEYYVPGSPQHAKKVRV